jgi:hypothetical protein
VRGPRLGGTGQHPSLSSRRVHQGPGGRSRATHVKQHLAAVRMLFDWLVTGLVLEVNPAHSVRVHANLWWFAQLSNPTALTRGVFPLRANVVAWVHLVRTILPGFPSHSAAAQIHAQRYHRGPDSTNYRKPTTTIMAIAPKMACPTVTNDNVLAPNKPATTLPASSAT